MKNKKDKRKKKKGGKGLERKSFSCLGIEADRNRKRRGEAFVRSIGISGERGRWLSAGILGEGAIVQSLDRINS